MSRLVRCSVVLALLLSALGVTPGPSVVAASVPHFLTLPFHDASSKRIQQGFYWTGCCHPAYHGGIDYIEGKLDQPSTWKSFPVYAAASGMACAQLASTQQGCIGGVGNRVLIRHKVAGQVFYSYYGHLRDIVPRIPRGDGKVHVRRGELLGYSWHSGDPCCVVHLHFQLMDGHWKTIDPYGLYATRARYPDPAGTNGRLVGSPSYWASDPPRTQLPAGGVTTSHGPPVATPRPPRATPRPPRTTPRPTPRPTPRWTPRPTPRATPRPMPSATPQPTQSPTASTCVAAAFAARPQPTPRPRGFHQTELAQRQSHTLAGLLRTLITTLAADLGSALHCPGVVADG